MTDDSFIEDGRLYEDVYSLNGTSLRNLVENYGIDATISIIVGQGGAWVSIGDNND